MPIYICEHGQRKITIMIKNYANSSSTSNAVSFVYRAAKKRRIVAMNNAKAVQNELGLAPKLFAIK